MVGQRTLQGEVRARFNPTLRTGETISLSIQKPTCKLDGLQKLHWDVDLSYLTKLSSINRTASEKRIN